MNRTALLAAVAVAVLGFALLALYVRQFRLEATGGEPIQLLMVRQDVAAGEPLTKDMLGTRPLPEAYVEDRHLRATELGRVLGVKVAVPIRANQTLLSTDLETAQRQGTTLSSRIRKGMRAMTIRARHDEAFNELIRPGDRVDVLLTKAKPGTDRRRVTVPLLQNLLVLAVGDNISTAYEQFDQKKTRSVTVSVTIGQASLLAQAQRDDGKLRLILRNDDDVEIFEGLAETDDTDVLEAEKRAKRQTGVRRIERVN